METEMKLLYRHRLYDETLFPKKDIQFMCLNMYFKVKGLNGWVKYQFHFNEAKRLMEAAYSVFKRRTKKAVSIGRIGLMFIYVKTWRVAKSSYRNETYLLLTARFNVHCSQQLGLDAFLWWWYARLPDR